MTAMAGHDGGIRMSGVSDDLAVDIEQRIDEFERTHEQDVLRDGPGWVPRIRGIDYAIAIAINAVIVVWLIVALAAG